MAWAVVSTGFEVCFFRRATGARRVLWGSAFMSSVLSSASWRSVVPDEWQAEVQSKLQPDENATAWVLVDLNAALKFHKIALILTDRRILTANLNEKNWESWSLAESQRLRLTDHGLLLGGVKLGKNIARSNALPFLGHLSHHSPRDGSAHKD